MSILRFYKDQNNYFNRIIKKTNLASEFSQTYQTFKDMNFNPNDGIRTEHVINWNENYTPDYLTVINKDVNANKSMFEKGFIRATAYDDLEEEIWSFDSREDLIESLILAPNNYFDLDKAAHYNVFEESAITISIYGEWKFNEVSFKLLNNIGIDFNIKFVSELGTEYTCSASTIKNFYNGIVDSRFLIEQAEFESTDNFVNIDFIFTDLDSSLNQIVDFKDYDTKLDIISSWFVIEAKRTRQNQYNLSLKRDLIADYYNNVINAPALIDRAKINDINNPLLFNPEGFSFNQIKKDEILLKDKIGKAWYVLYFKKNMPSQSGSYIPSNTNYDERLNTDLAHSIYNSGTYKYTENEDINITYRSDANDWAWSYPSNQYIMHNKESTISNDFDSISTLTSVIWFNNDSNQCKYQLEYAFSGQFATLKSNMLIDTGNSGQISKDVFNKLKSSNEKIILTSDNKLYKVSVVDTITYPSGKLSSGNTVNQCKGLINSTNLDQSDHFGANTVGYSMTLHTLIVNTEEIKSGTYTWTIDFTDCPCEDSDFNIIAIPYGDTRFYNGNSTFLVKGSVNDRFVQSIIKTIPHADNSGYLVDVQLLPYCPDPNIYATGTNIGIDVSSYTNPSDLTDHPRYSFNNAESIYDNSFMLYVVKSNISFNITKTINVPSFTGDNAIDYKISNECDLYKLVSPNYNGSFEFSVAKNQGVSMFNVDMTLKPYNPYIHINPDFKALYGSDWNDSRGLICGGDFSLPIYSSAWQTYELQNKNYQNIFDRQIRNLDFTQGQERIYSYVGLATGTVGGTTSGAMAGALAGGGWGALAGGLTGAVASVAGGTADIALLSERQAEQKSFALDNFKYQLGNIKALPDTINKTTPFTYNNKKFPFIEYYSSTDTEKTLLQNSIKYKSMKVNAIGTISEYLQEERTYISATLIRFEELGLNSNEAYEIYLELMKGVYI